MNFIVSKIRWFLLHTPIFCTVFLGRTIGFLFYLNKKKRFTAFKNLKMVFPKLTYYEIENIIKKSFCNYGLAIAEAFVSKRIIDQVKIKGKENIDESKGGIFVAIHEGSWEVYNFWFANYFKNRYLMFVKEPKPEDFASFINELRNKEGLITTGSLKDVVKALANNNFLGMVIDQGMDSAFVYLDFFSQTVPTPKGAVFLAKKYNKPIYPCFGYREKGVKATIEISKAIDTQDKTEEEILCILHRLYEDYLSKYPQEYIWSYKRFKRKKNLKIIILSDKKTGHVKQSLAFLSYLKEKNDLISSEVIEINYRNKLSRTLIDFFAAIIKRRSFKLARIYTWFLPDKIREKLEKNYADIIISTGSFSAPLNKLYSATLGAKSVVILKPNIGLNNFDLAIIPEHDREKKILDNKNIFSIKGALSYPGNTKDKGQKCKDFFKLSDKKKIAVFIGGAFSSKDDFFKNIRRFMNSLKDFSSKEGYSILFSTSRRTHLAVEMFLEDFLAHMPNVEAVVYPTRANYDFVFEGFVDLADMVLVTGESISMVSEVLAQNKPVVAIILEHYDRKRRYFYRSLGENISLLYRPFELDKVSYRIPRVFEENKKNIQAAIEVL